MTLVLVGKGLVLRGLPSKIDVIWVLGHHIPSKALKMIIPFPNGGICWLPGGYDRRHRI